MKISVVEYMTEYGIGYEAYSPDHEMYIQGLAMRTAVSRDLESAGYEIVEKHDLSEKALIIAPDNQLEYEILRYYEAGIPDKYYHDEGYKYLKPPARAIILSNRDAREMAADKLSMAEHWIRKGVQTPRTLESRLWWPESYPFLIKERFGSGSQGIHLINNLCDWEATESLRNTKSHNLSGERSGSYIAQEIVTGRAASIAFLIGEGQIIPLLPAFQILSNDGRFQYLGGKLPIEADLATRAIKLGWQAVECVPGLAGYIGVDLILGDAADGSQDYAIEINPRLTTSYVGLRQLADFNIAQAMIDVVEGRPVDYVKWKPGRVQFWPDGRVEHDPTPGAVFS